MAFALNRLQKYADDVNGLSFHPLSPGLLLVALKRSSTSAFYASLTVRAGRVDERDGEEGVSHFLEHAVYLGSQGFSSRDDLDLALLALGGEQNAATSHELTSFYVSGRGERLAEGLHLLADLTYRPTLRPGRDLELEREVILAEIEEDLSDDGEPSNVSDVAYGRLLGALSAGQPIAGTSASVRGISAEMLQSYHQALYKGGNTVVLSVVSDLEADEVRALCGVHFAQTFGGSAVQSDAKGGLSPQGTGRKSVDVQSLPPQVSFDVIPEKSSFCDMSLFFLSAGGGMGRSFFCRELLQAILFCSEQSFLFGRARKAGLVYSFGGQQSAHENFCVSQLNAEVPDGKMRSLIKMTFESLYDLAKNGVDMNFLELCRGRLLFEAEMLKDHAVSIVDEVAESACLGAPFLTFSEQSAVINSLTAADIQAEVCALLTANRIAVVLKGKKPARYEKLILSSLLKLSDDVKKLKLLEASISK